MDYKADQLFPLHDDAATTHLDSLIKQGHVQLGIQSLHCSVFAAK
jgi:hypothetical protein